MEQLWPKILDFLRGVAPEAHLTCISDAGGLILGIFGIFMAFRAKRPGKFRFKLAAVFLLPIICSLGSLHPLLQPSEFNVRAYMSTFVILLTLLYWREVGHLSAAVREQKEAFSGLLRAMPDMIWMKDADGRYQFTDDEVTDSLIICDPKEVLGRTDREIARDHRVAGGDFILPSIFEGGEWANRTGEIISAEHGDEDLVLRVFRVPVHVIDKRTRKKRLWGVVGIGQNMTGYIHPDSPEVTRHLKKGKIGPAS